MGENNWPWFVRMVVSCTTSVSRVGVISTSLSGLWCHRWIIVCATRSSILRNETDTSDADAVSWSRLEECQSSPSAFFSSSLSLSTVLLHHSPIHPSTPWGLKFYPAITRRSGGTHTFVVNTLVNCPLHVLVISTFVIFHHSVSPWMLRPTSFGEVGVEKYTLQSVW